MTTLRLTIGGNSYIGAFITATDSFCIFSPVAAKYMQRISQTLGTSAISTSVAASNLVGVFVAANSKGILLPLNSEDSELQALKKSLPNVLVQKLHSDVNALKNNILANDRIAIVNPDYSSAEVKEISNVLDVEVIKMRIAKSSTVGSTNILTNRGIIINNRASEEEVSEIEKIVNLPADQTTANTGSIYIGLSAVANSKGLIVGDATTGYEMARMESVLF